MTSSFKKLEWELLSEKEGVRYGRLRQSNPEGIKELPTPFCFALTESGSLPFISAAQSKLLPPHGLAILASHFHESWGSIEKLPRGIRDFCNIDDDRVVLLVPGPLANVTAVPGEKKKPTSGASALAFYESPSGRFSLDTASYAGVIAAARPDVYSPLAWELPSAPSAAGKNATRKSVVSTLEWHHGVVNALGSRQQEELAGRGFFSVVGASNLIERRISAQAMSQMPSFGVEIVGLSTGESLSLREEIIKASLDQVSSECPRFISGIGTPKEILHLISMGIDIFSSDYPTLATSLGLALVFEFEAAVGGQKINLRDPCYLTDAQPIFSSCPCYACSNHSKAYIHHLFNTHEMLAETLLQIHNWTHYLNWFAWLQLKKNDN